MSRLFTVFSIIRPTLKKTKSEDPVGKWKTSSHRHKGTPEIDPLVHNFELSVEAYGDMGNNAGVDVTQAQAGAEETVETVETPKKDEHPPADFQKLSRDDVLDQKY